MLELRQRYPLADLLKVAGLARSTFYYQQKVLQARDKYASLKDRIRTLFEQHKGRYESPRVLRRHQFAREWCHEQDEQVFT